MQTYSVVRNRTLKCAALILTAAILQLSCGSNSVKQASGPIVHEVKPGVTMRFAFLPNAPAAFWDMAEHGLHKFEHETGVHVDLKFPPTGKVEEQNQILESLVDQGYQGVALSVIAPHDQVRDINRVARSMNVVTTDSDAPQSDRIAFVGPNQEEAGAAAGNEILALLPQGGKVAVFCGDFTAENAVQRMKGIKQAIAGKPVQIVATKEDGKDQSRARAQVEDVINAYPDIGVLVGLWSYNGPAIRDALLASGKQGKIHAVAFDEEAGTLEGIRSHLIAATIVLTPFEYGYLSARLLYDLARKGQSAVPPGRDINTGFSVIRADNLDAYMQKLAEERKW